MKIRLLLVTLISSLLALPLAHAQDAMPKKKGPDTELGKHMSEMNDAFKTLRAQAADASKNAESLALATTIREHATAGLKLEPAKKADVPAEEQAAFVASFRKDLQGLIDLVSKLETALKANDNAGAAKLLDDMAAAQKAGHKQYKKAKKAA